MFRILYRNNPTSSISKAPQKVHDVKESPLLGQKTILLQSILMELIVSPVFLSASTLRKLEVGMSISDKTLYNVFSIIQEEIMINMSRMMQQNMRCSNCSSSLLQRIGTQLYCLQCETINNMFQFQIQMVPITYQPNCRNRRELDMQRKLNAHIRGFICKYGSHYQEQQIRNLRQKLMKIKEMTPNSKGTREAAAVVVYCSLKQQIKMSIADFCKQNNLKQKSFNRKYKVYDKLYNQKREIATQIMIQRQGNQFIKMEQRNEHFEAHSNQQNDLQEKSELSSSDKIFLITFADCRKGIEIIFDEIFPNFYLKQKKQVIVQKLITKITTVPPQFFSQIDNKALGKPIQLYYLIFAIIKTFGYKINFERYNEIVRNKTGYTLRKSYAFEVKKHYDEFHKKEKQAQSESFELIQVNRIKIQDNNSEVLRIRFPMADSENEFSYQYYFSDQFYN